ncbi:hypothetical protein D1AOALGA4SA_11097 [Olavius algarvensis Delta 1 endosymbiont]|nr:hypothetical protein D1AOALGA4SA_11097 [Olavius algarvensis Delta 1 endosymbiont]
MDDRGVRLRIADFGLRNVSNADFGLQIAECLTVAVNLNESLKG